LCAPLGPGRARASSDEPRAGPRCPESCAIGAYRFMGRTLDPPAPAGLANCKLDDAVGVRAHGLPQKARRLVERLVGEAKRAPVHGPQRTRAQLAERARRLLG